MPISIEEQKRRLADEFADVYAEVRKKLHEGDTIGIPPATIADMERALKRGLDQNLRLLVEIESSGGSWSYPSTMTPTVVRAIRDELADRLSREFTHDQVGYDS